MLSAEEITSSLISFRTVAPKGSERECAKFLFDYLKDMKVADSDIEIYEFDENRANIIATFGTKKDPGLILSGHMDVVPSGDEKLWRTDPFRSEKRDSRLFGRGAADMKGGLAAIVKSIENQVDHQALSRKLIFAATAGEETGFVGLRRLIKDSIMKSTSSEYVVIGEPTDLRPARAHRGIYRIKIKFLGKSSHAGTPELGVNAIEHACKFVEGLDMISLELLKDKDDLLGSTTLTPTLIEGGIGENVVPPSASVVIDSRRLPIHSTVNIRLKIESLCKDLKIEYSTEEFVNEQPLNTPDGNFLTGLAEEITGSKSGACAFGTEGSLYWGELGIPTIVIGPGSVEQAHIANEYVELSQIEKAISIYSKFIERICL
jgi:acetylornithine deacetylase/succinyl-diaminopimelate desuccinylase family protein